MHSTSPRVSQESSWEPPPEWQGTPATLGADYQHDERNTDGAGGLAVGGGGENHERGQNTYHVPHGYASSISAANSTSVPYGPSGAGELEGGGHGAGIGADATEGGAADEMTTPVEGSHPSTKSRAQGAGSAGSGTRVAPRGGGSKGGTSSGGGSSLDRTSADELSQWSLEKLREVSKVNNSRLLEGGRLLLFFLFYLSLFLLRLLLFYYLLLSRESQFSHKKVVIHGRRVCIFRSARQINTRGGTAP